MGKWRRKRSLPHRWLRNTLIAKYGSVCYLCGRAFASLHDITIDHWTPLSQGGSQLIENCRLAHYDCNQEKRDMSPAEWSAMQGEQ